MARTLLATTVLFDASKAIPVTADLTVTNGTAADVDNKNYAICTSNTLIEITNTDASTHNYVITSAPVFVRSGDISHAIAAGARKLLRVPRQLFQQAVNGQIYFEADHAGVKFNVLELPF